MKKTIKKILAVGVIVLVSGLLTACGGDEDTSSDPSTLKTYDGGLFTIDINPGWQVITESDFYAEIPDEAVVAFTKPEAYDGFFINVNIVQEQLTNEVSSIDYARANINLAAQNLTDYEKKQEANIDLNGTPAMVHIFTARLNPTENLIRFIQLYATQGNTGYIVTGGMPAETPENLRDEVGNVVTSFLLK